MVIKDKNIFLASDHAGFKLKNSLKVYLRASGYSYVDLGCYTEEAVDYPDYSQKLILQIKTQKDFGVLICGSGIGMSISANRYKHIRAALCTSEAMAISARKHNDANVLVLGSRITEEKTAIEILKTFMNTKFSKEKRHIRRISKI